jgi:isocitrate dehydrogenase
LYWAQALAAQSDDAGMRAKFATIAAELTRAEAQIVGELNATQGKAVDIGGYYHPDSGKCGAAMRPSGTFNRILATLS